MKVSLVAFLLLICAIATAATGPSSPSRLHVGSPKEVHNVNDEGFFQGMDSVENQKAEEVPVPVVDVDVDVDVDMDADLKDGRKGQKEENNDDESESAMKVEDYFKQVILDLRGQIQERDVTIKELRDELRMKEWNRRPDLDLDLQGDHVEPVLGFAWKFVLLMQASSKSLEEKKKEKKVGPLMVIGSNDFVADHLARHKFLDDTIPMRVEAMQNQYKSQHDSRSQFANLKGVSGSFMSSRAGLHRPRPASSDGLHNHSEEMVSLIYENKMGLSVRRYLYS